MSRREEEKGHSAASSAGGHAGGTDQTQLSAIPVGADPADYQTPPPPPQSPLDADAEVKRHGEQLRHQRQASRDATQGAAGPPSDSIQMYVNRAVERLTAQPPSPTGVYGVQGGRQRGLRNAEDLEALQRMLPEQVAAAMQVQRLPNPNARGDEDEGDELEVPSSPLAAPDTPQSDGDSDSSGSVHSPPRQRVRLVGNPTEAKAEPVPGTEEKLDPPRPLRMGL